MGYIILSTICVVLYLAVGFSIARGGQEFGEVPRGWRGALWIVGLMVAWPAFVVGLFLFFAVWMARGGR